MKLLKVLVAALLLAAMVVPAIAEDRMKLSGEMRVRGYLYDTDYSDVDGTDEKGGWNDSRLRVGGDIAVAEGVSVHFRFDAVESGENSSDATAFGFNPQSAVATQYSQRRGDIQFDKAYLQVVKNGFTLMAGQLYFGGMGYTGKMTDVVGPGFIGKYDGLTVNFVKRRDKNTGNNSFAKTSSVYGNGDATLLSAKYDFKGEGFSVTPMLAYNYDQRDDFDYNVFGAGLAGSTTIGPVAIKGEFNYFKGSDISSDLPGTWVTSQYGITDSDYAIDFFQEDGKGAQLYLDGSMNATDTVKVGVMGFYADGQTSKYQITNMNQDGNVQYAFADYHPESYGTWSTDFVDEFVDIYDPMGVSAGVIAGQLYADIKATEEIGLQFAGMYFTNQEDKYIDYDGYTLNAGITYALAANTVLSLHANYVKYNVDEIFDTNVDVKTDTFQSIAGIQVKF
jgi:hypothetical protein